MQVKWWSWIANLLGEQVFPISFVYNCYWNDIPESPLTSGSAVE